MKEEIKVTIVKPEGETTYRSKDIYLSPSFLQVTARKIHCIEQDGDGTLRVQLVIDPKVMHQILAISHAVYQPPIPEDLKCEDEEA